MKRNIELDPSLRQLREIAIEIPFEQVISWVYNSKSIPPPSRWQRWRIQWQRWLER